MSFDPTLIETVRAAARTAGVPEDLALGVTQQESKFNPLAQSDANAWGLMQIKPATADWMLGLPNGTTTGFDLLDPAFNAKVGTKFLAWLLKRYNGDAKKTAAAYNWGPGNIPAGLPFDENRPGINGEPMPSETRNYWQKVLNYASAWAGKVSQAEAAVANVASDVVTAFQDQSEAMGWTEAGAAKGGLLLLLGVGAVVLIWWATKE